MIDLRPWNEPGLIALWWTVHLAKQWWRGKWPGGLPLDISLGGPTEKLRHQPMWYLNLINSLSIFVILLWQDCSGTGRQQHKTYKPILPMCIRSSSGQCSRWHKKGHEWNIAKPHPPLVYSTIASVTTHSNVEPKARWFKRSPRIWIFFRDIKDYQHDVLFSVPPPPSPHP